MTDKQAIEAYSYNYGKLSKNQIYQLVKAQTDFFIKDYNGKRLPNPVESIEYYTEVVESGNDADPFFPMHGGIIEGFLFNGVKFPVVHHSFEFITKSQFDKLAQYKELLRYISMYGLYTIYERHSNDLLRDRYKL